MSSAFYLMLHFSGDDLSVGSMEMCTLSLPPRFLGRGVYTLGSHVRRGMS